MGPADADLPASVPSGCGTLEPCSTTRSMWSGCGGRPTRRSAPMRAFCRAGPPSPGGGPGPTGRRPWRRVGCSAGASSRRGHAGDGPDAPGRLRIGGRRGDAQPRRLRRCSVIAEAVARHVGYIGALGSRRTQGRGSGAAGRARHRRRPAWPTCSARSGLDLGARSPRRPRSRCSPRSWPTARAAPPCRCGRTTARSTCSRPDEIVGRLQVVGGRARCRVDWRLRRPC